MNIFPLNESLIDYLYIFISFTNDIEVDPEKNLQWLANDVLPDTDSEYFTQEILFLFFLILELPVH